jgi:HK97 gp10 family phage protein
VAKTVKYTIVGLGRLQRSLDALPPALAGKVIRKAVRESMKPVARTAASDAPSKTGKLARSIRVRAMKRKKGRIGVAVQTDKGNFQGETFYGAMREFGHAIRRVNRGPAVGQAKGSHFMQGAYETHGSSARADAIGRIKSGLPAAIAEARRAGK